MRRYQKFIVLIIGFFLIQPAYANESKASYADLLDKGLNRWQNADFSDALDYYGDALKKAKTNSEKSKARLYRGITFYQMALWDSAIDELQKALKLDQAQKGYIHYYMGVAYYGKRFKKEAIHHLDLALKDNLSPGLNEKAKIFLKRTKDLQVKKFNLFSALGFGYNNNVPLDRITGESSDTTVKEDVGTGISAMLKPTYTLRAFKRSTFTIDNTLYGFRYFNPTHRKFDVWSYSLVTALNSPWTLGNTGVKFKLPFEYGMVHSGRTKGETVYGKRVLEQVSNKYTFNPSMHLIYSP